VVGDVKSALAVSDQAIAMVGHNGDLFHMPEQLRIKEPCSPHGIQLGPKCISGDPSKWPVGNRRWHGSCVQQLILRGYGTDKLDEVRHETCLQRERIAALGIVYFHSWVSITRFPTGTAYQIPSLSYYGWFAVDLFFAISGYVICLVVGRDSFDVRSFLIRRVFRLYPLWLVMLTVFAATAGLWRGLTPRETLEFFLYSATLLPTIGNPFYNVGWSLQHEIAFLRNRLGYRFRALVCVVWHYSC
jgi:hypothetical protein